MGENFWARGENVCFRGERIVLLRLLVVVFIVRALGRRFCFGGESFLAGLHEVRIDSMAILFWVLGQEDLGVYLCILHGYHNTFHIELESVEKGVGKGVGKGGYHIL